MVENGPHPNRYGEIEMESWEKVFMSRYEGYDSYQDACEFMVATLNQEACSTLFLDSTDLDNLKKRKCMPGGRFWANMKAPKEKRQLANCYALTVEDSRESWAKLLHDVAMFTMFGGGLGVDYSPLRANKMLTSTPGQLAGGPCSLIRSVDAMVGELRSCRRGALLAQLAWDHPDIWEFLELKNGKALPRTNISVKYDERWHDIMDFGPDHPDYGHAIAVFMRNIELAISVGEPGVLWNGVPNWQGRIYTNACGELRTETPFDSCNIGGIFPLNFENYPDFLCDSNDEVESVSKTMVKILLLGVRASITAVPEADRVRKELNRLLIGVGGAFPFCEVHGHRGRAFIRNIYSNCRYFAHIISEEAGMAIPRDVTGIAPHGTLGLIAGCTGGIEPPYAEAFVKKILPQDGRSLKPTFKVSIDPVYQMLRDKGIICRTAQSLSLEDRLEWQAFNQSCVDMGISSTINLPARGQPGNDRPLEEIVAQLLKYHRKLVGLTFYPDGAIEGQPQVAIPYEEALKYGTDALVSDDVEAMIELTNLMCKSGVCGA
jgi:ribonucleoside-diphosphate reductase alpha chain